MKSLRKIALVAFLSMVTPVLVQAQSMSALETAEAGVSTLLETVLESKAFFLSDRDRYFSEVEGVLSTFVDFEAVAEVVMSRFAESATDQQRQRFSNMLKSTLTRFYGASLVSYEDQELVFLPPESQSDPRADTVVVMELRGGDSTLQLQYQMFINENDEWKLKNLSLGGINLGRQYFAQFTALMSEHGNDIDQVLENWQ